VESSGGEYVERRNPDLFNGSALYDIPVPSILRLHHMVEAAGEKWLKANGI
jgi:hypothetical protein